MNIMDQQETMNGKNTTCKTQHLCLTVETTGQTFGSRMKFVVKRVDCSYSFTDMLFQQSKHLAQNISCLVKQTANRVISRTNHCSLYFSVLK